ncbi:GNAT family N-acetyltransferase [Paenisporosarcina indica]|uniref:GNAT family N-acetyltransferase n=1 Tax=Paenisporosarcina indica TaxID=650093 RepID=UPI00094F60C1|nr:GNAT family N-acetyltransferase [Paenisporosarcina indica]
MISKVEKFTFFSETERLIVRPLKKSDYEKWLNGFNNRFASHHRHDEGKIDMQECTQEWFANLVDKYQRLAKNDIAHVFDIFRKQDGVHLGTVDFSTLARDDFQWARIGYTIHNQYWQQGYAKEAVREALQIAFRDLGFHRIEAHINIDNEPSMKLAEAVGMKFECKREGFIFEFGEWTDNLIYFINAN